MSHRPLARGLWMVRRLLLARGLLAGCLLTGCWTLAGSSPSEAEEVSYFRRGSGVYSGQRALPSQFSDERPKWRQSLPAGISSPCVTADSIYLTSYDAEKKQLATLALDRKDGSLRWQQAVPFEKLESFHPVGSPASCTPAFDGERLFAFFGSYGVLCYDRDGRLLWQRKMGPFQDEFGAASSPILLDDKLILNQDHDVNSFLTALDAETGETQWRVSREEATRSYSTPVIWTVDGKPQIVVAGALQLAAYDPQDGKKLWWVNGLSRIVDSTPAIVDNVLYLATWTPGGDTSERISMEPFAEALAKYDADKDGRVGKEELPAGAVLTRFFRIDLNQDLALDRGEWEKHASVFQRAQNVAMAVLPGARGDATKTHVKWIQRRGLPTVPSSLVYDGVFYMVKDSGIITSLNAETGEIIKQGRAKGRGNYYASLVAGDGKVYLASERGVLTVLKAGADWEVLDSHDFKERILATPVLSAGQFFLRTDDALYCFESPRP